MPSRAIDSIIALLQSCDDTQFPDCIDSIAIGGSHSRGTNDHNSDLDLFVLLRTDDWTPPRQSVHAIVSWLGRPAILRGPVYVPHFGHSLTLVYSDLSICQVNINTTSSLELNHMRAKSRIVLDRSGKLTHIALAAKNLPDNTSSVFTEEYRYFWIRGLYAWKSLVRGELWRSTEYLSQMRKPMLQIIRINTGTYTPDTSPHSPATRFEEVVGGALSREVEFSLPQYSPEHVHECLRASYIWFQRATESHRFARFLSKEDKILPTYLIKASGSGG